MSISPAQTGGALPLLKAQPQPPHPAPTLTGSTQDKDRENTELDGTQAPGTLPPEIREGPVPHRHSLSPQPPRLLASGNTRCLPSFLLSEQAAEVFRNTHKKAGLLQLTPCSYGSNLHGAN